MRVTTIYSLFYCIISSYCVFYCVISSYCVFYCVISSYCVFYCVISSYCVFYCIISSYCVFYCVISSYCVFYCVIRPFRVSLNLFLTSFLKPSVEDHHEIRLKKIKALRVIAMIASITYYSITSLVYISTGTSWG